MLPLPASKAGLDRSAFALQALQEGVGLPALVEAFCTQGYNRRAKLHYLGPLLANLSQLPEARRELLSRDR